MSTNLNFKYVENLKKPGRYTDALVRGLHLWVKPNLNKYWIFRYSQNGKQQNLSLGPYPLVSIAEARILAQQTRDKIRSGINPIKERQNAKDEAVSEARNKISFRDFAIECINVKRPEWKSEKHAAQWLYTLKEFAFPVIGDKALDEIEMEDILKILTPIWTTTTETASRLRGRLEWILAAATTKKLRSGPNPATWKNYLQTILPAPKKVKNVVHHKAMHYIQIPNFISQLRESDNVAALALEFTILNGARSGEVFGGLKSEIQDGLWVIPASRMKAKKEHRVPLSQRSLDLLAIASAIDPGSKYLFSRKGKPLSNMAMSMILRRMKLDVTTHGFRSSFRDWISEQTDYSSEVAEMSLAHAIANKIEAAYRRQDLLEKRRALLIDWEAYCSSNPKNNVHQLKAA
jgi:integrase